MVAVLTTLLCQVAGLAAWLLAWLNPVGGPVEVLAGYLLGVAAVIGLAALALTCVACRLRPVRPPPGMAALAVGISLAPWLWLLIRAVTA
jgi:hypothetical protein